MSLLVLIADAKQHLREAWTVDDPREAELQQKLDAAESAVLTYIGTTEHWRTVVATWLDVDAPAEPPLYVRAAILLQTAELWRFRGDDTDSDQPPRHPIDELQPGVAALLRRTRDPVLA